MAHRLKPTHKDNLAPIFLWTSVALAILGVIDSIYLVIYKYTGNNAMCLGNGGCHNVNFSPYSQIASVPISVFGLVAYLAILGVLLLEDHLEIAKENGPLAVFGISLAGVAFSAYLTWLELYVIHAICPFCVASAVFISLIFILAIIRLTRQTAH